MSQSHPHSQSEKYRHLIKDINLSPTTSRYPVILKLIIDGVECHELTEIEPDKLLRWNNIPSCDVLPESHISLAIYEKHPLRQTRVGTAEYAVSSVKHPSEITTVCDSHKFAVTVSFHPPSVHNTAAADALLMAQETNRQKRVLEKLGPTRDAIKMIVDISKAVSELHPAAQVTLGICDLAWSKLEAQEKCDASVESLVEGLVVILPYVDIVKKAAILPNLQRTVVTLLNLIEDVSRFIVDYNEDGGAVKNMRLLLSSSAQGQVEELLKRLEDLKDEFDRGLIVQTMQTVDMSAHHALLNELKPVGKARYDATRACLPGTRKAFLDEVLDWCLRSDNSEALLWIHGHAGLGKSAIATSLSQELHEKQQLAASFFCKRDDPERRDPQRMLTTIVHGLATHHPPYGAAVATAIQGDTSLCSAPIQMQFDRLVRDPLQSSTMVPPTTSLVIVMDALDECGDEVTRRQILGYMHIMSQLTDWLKVVFTSRPDQDIENFMYGSNLTRFSTKNVNNYNASNDIQAFIQHRITGSRKAKRLHENAAELLGQAAQGLFIWAKTACEFILGTHDPSGRLKIVLEEANSTQSTQSTRTLDALYTTAITASAKDGGEDHVKIVRHCLGLIVVCSARTPLSVDTLSKLFGDQVEKAVMQSVVDSLGSVLYVDDSQGDAVRVCHPSFADYLTNPERSGRFCVDVDEENSVLTESCLRTMMAGLRFNICGLETSYKRNRDVHDLKTRIDREISLHLQYSCVYWTSHILKTDWKRHHTMLEEFIAGTAMIYWIEVLSLLGKLDTELSSVQDLGHWYKGNVLKERINDIERFSQAFYDAISESTPHLYLSALAFLPAHSTMTDLEKRHFPNCITIERGMEDRWSSWLRCISLESEVASVCVSSDGRHIISGSFDNTVRVWNADTGAAVGHPLTGHSGEVSSVVVSPDGRRIISGSWDMTVRVWDADTGAAVGHPLTGHSRWVSSVAVSPDGRRIISGSYDKTVRVWDADTGAAVGHPLTGHSDRVSSVAVSPDSRRIISGSLDKTVRVWDADTGAAVGHPLTGHSSVVSSLAVSPDDRRIISGSHDNTVRVWDVGACGTVDVGSILSIPSNITFLNDPSMLPYPPLKHLPYASCHDFPHLPLNTCRLLPYSTPDGWVCVDNDKLLFWLPAEYRRTRPDDSLFVTPPGDPLPVWLNYSKFVHGTNWTCVMASVD